MLNLLSLLPRNDSIKTPSFLDGDTSIILAGDTSYNEHLMLAGRVDGVSADESVSGTTLDSIRRLALTRNAIYLSTHDPQPATRLTTRQRVGAWLDNFDPNF